MNADMEREGVVRGTHEDLRDSPTLGNDVGQGATGLLLGCEFQDQNGPAMCAFYRRSGLGARG